MRLPLFLTIILLAASQSAGCNKPNVESEPGIETTARVDDEQVGENKSGIKATEAANASSTAEPMKKTQAAMQLKALLDEYEAKGGARLFAKRFLEFAEQNSEDPSAADALTWVVRNVRGKSETTRALEMLAVDHSKRTELGPVCKDVAGSRSIAAHKLLRVLVDENPNEEVRAHACYYLASLLDVEANLVSQLNAQPDLAPRVLQYYGKDYGEYLASLEPAVLEEQRVQAYQRILNSFADVQLEDEKLGVVAEKMLFQIRHLSIGKASPDIVGVDIDGDEFKLSDFRGKVVLLTFWGHW